MEVASIFRLGLPSPTGIFGRNEQLGLTELICLFANENDSPWSMASQVVVVGMIWIKNKERLYPLFKANESQKQMNS